MINDVLHIFFIMLAWCEYWVKSTNLRRFFHDFSMGRVLGEIKQFAKFFFYDSDFGMARGLEEIKQFSTFSFFS